MSNKLSGFRRIALSVFLAATAALPVQVEAQAAAPAAKAAPAAQSDMLPFPLNPVVPAGQRQCSAKTASGLGTRVLRDAQGVKPALGDYVLVNYIGYLAADGTVFDQNMQQAFATDGVIKGFSEGLQLMSKGSVWRFCVPAALGYADKGMGAIPANSDLVFQVELVDYKTAAEVATIRANAEKQAVASQDQSAAPAAAAPAPAPKADKPKN